MPITTINPSVALVVIDMQKGIVAMPTAHSSAGVSRKVVELVDTFRDRKHPVVLVTVGWSPDGGDALKTRVQAATAGRTLPPDFTEIIPELRPDAQRDVFIRKHQWGAFFDTGLDLQLRRRGITDIVLCGIATSIGVESTARDAWERGYNLTFASDAMTDLSNEAHDRALEIIFPRIGEIGTTAEIVAAVPR
ncbi:MAG: hydrolase [Candidatus Eremiobacteraeota bacterium]|nr:hydrolase [Candidatus Eremiobacteraeota bacterium]